MLGQRSLPSDLKSMGVEALTELCEEIRQEIVSTCLRKGGHIGASLGVVEIAVALHRIFNSPTDKIIWDVGHQAYAHKLLTGRATKFTSLRSIDGLSGFLSRDESPHDAYGAGHSSTALSAALGFAYESKNWTIAVVGDGGLTAGVSLEALNNIQSSHPRGPLLVVLNDNQMSISENVGGIHRLLSTGEAAEFFRLWGFDYLGPMDGNDLPTVLGTLNGIHSAAPTRPVLLHLRTLKGKGYSPAEVRPAFYHGVGPAQTGEVSGKVKSSGEKSGATERSWSDVFGTAIVAAAETDPRVLAITAAMGDGTGLLRFAEKFPDRFFDVGIAEPHAATFAAGLAANGWKPVCAVYSTFLQRSFDALIHDVALQKLPVIFAVDRAGLVGADGPTHHGVFDLAYAGMIPGLEIYTPEFSEDVKGCLATALSSGRPSMIRYPRGNAPNGGGIEYAPLRRLGADPRLASKLIVSFGPVGTRIKKILGKMPPRDSEKISHLSVVAAKPAGAELLTHLRSAAERSAEILFFEDGVFHGSLSADLAAKTPGLRSRFFTYPDEFVPHGEVSELEARFGRTDASILEAFTDGL